VRVRGGLDRGALERSVNEFVRRHEVLRTTFALADGEPVQVVGPARETNLDFADLSGLPAAEAAAEAQRMMGEEARAPFDLSGGPLLRVRVLRTGDQEHFVLFTMHHIVSDGWSMGVLVREIGALYDAFAAGLPSPLEELPIQYADFAVWQRGLLQGDYLKSLLDYWKLQLDAVAPRLELPVAKPRPAAPTFRGARRTFVIPAETAGRLRALNREAGVTMFMTLLAAFKTLLYHYSGQSDVVVGTGIANRTRRETEGLIGCFYNLLVLRTDLGGDPTFRELLARVRRMTLDAYAHQDLPFEKLVETLQPERQLSQTPLFQVLFLLENTPMQSLSMSELKLEQVHVSNKVTTFDLTLFVWDEPEALSGVLEYNTDLFDPPHVARMLDDFQSLLARLAADPSLRLGEVSPSAGEAGELVGAFNDELEN
jgi:hypothetical protein